MTNIEEQFIALYNRADAVGRQRINDILYGASLVASKEQNNGHLYSDSSNDSRLHRDREEVMSAGDANAR